MTTHYRNVPGMHMHPAERELLAVLAAEIEQKFKDPIIVNIGIAANYGHCSMRCLREGSVNSWLLGIDIEEQGKIPACLNLSKTEFIIGDSSKFLSEWPIKIQMAFVDGDHSESGVEKDINALLPLMEKGSILAFHDYGHYGKPGFEHVYGVRRAVDRAMNTNTDWILRGDVVSIRYFERVK